jgi:hypothetical protein
VHRPGHHKNNEHFTELLGTPTRLVLLLLENATLAALGEMADRGDFEFLGDKPAYRR